ncbi:MAG: hypothetical protein ACRDRA_06195, partial [Pseudonocardiaceae bacterium]
MALLFRFWLLLQEAPMGTAAVIWLGILAWVVLAIVVGLATGRMIKLRNRQCPGSTEPGQPADAGSGRRSSSSRI